MKERLTNKIKSVVARYLLKNQYAKVDMRLMIEIYDTIREFEFYKEKVLVAEHNDFGFLYTGDKITLNNGDYLYLLAVIDGFVIMRYSGYYPFVISQDKVIEKINQINK
jgi:hypothetical protein